MASLQRMTHFWDKHINGWLDGRNNLSESDHKMLEAWFESYDGKDKGKATREAIPEPWIGDLTNPDTARLVILGLNPGDYKPTLQARREGRYSKAVHAMGSFTTWAATNPYLIAPWLGKKDEKRDIFGTNRYHVHRLRFARNWLGDQELPSCALALIELYPWHSTKLSAPIEPDPETIRRFILDPIDELTKVRDIFAFGKNWSFVLKKLNLELKNTLGKGGEHYGSSAKTRTVQVYQSPAGKRIIVMWHQGSAGPPSEHETRILREALS